MLADKLADTANLAAAGLLFGQFVAGQPFSFRLAMAGFGAWAALLGWSVLLARRRRM